MRTLTKSGAYGDGGGLYLQVRGPAQRSWLYRFKLHGKPHLMGLGPEAEVSLAEARDAAIAARKLVREGINPIQRRRHERVANAEQESLTFDKVADAYITAHEASWRNPKHRQQWRNTIDTYASPVIGNTPVAEVDIHAVLRVLKPLWEKKTETASRVRGRIESILSFATTKGWRTGENPARWRGHLQNLLPARAKLTKPEHHAALPWRDVGTFVAELRKQQGIAAIALQFTILTAVRTGEAIGARWKEFDLTDTRWTIPADRMKAGRQHRVPLSDEAVELLRAAEKLRVRNSPDDHVFPGGRSGKGLSNMAMAELLKRMQRTDITVHGFRSTFRDWCAEAGNYPREIAEAALAHALRDKTEAAYQRSDLWDKRRRLMADWATYCSRVPPTRDVIALRS